MAAVSFHDVRASDAIQGLAATARHGTLTYRVYIAAEALRELGAEVDEASWLAAFHGHEQAIGNCASALHRRKPNAAVFIASLADCK